MSARHSARHNTRGPGRPARSRDRAAQAGASFMSGVHVPGSWHSKPRGIPAPDAGTATSRGGGIGGSSRGRPRNMRDSAPSGVPQRGAIAEHPSNSPPPSPTASAPVPWRPGNRPPGRMRGPRSHLLLHRSAATDTDKVLRMDITDLTPLERRIWRAFPHGTAVDVRPGEGEDPAALRSADRDVRAAVVRALLLTGSSESGEAPALRVAGARIIDGGSLASSIFSTWRYTTRSV